jgi:hypothetical protein
MLIFIKVISSFSNKLFMWIDAINLEIILRPWGKVLWMVGMMVLETSPHSAYHCIPLQPPLVCANSHTVLVT